ncbi:uncharacterized protein LOC130069486 [Rhinichthys klamathensis goyatoka]|uniref:uncharacterized protein LOC130069486 n=1 Tax=Rhinichthys klamathensis goyatoka TaxID=3034132 RepID=UPI0024B5D625|nr:uncharacterized protein LOC130069486 [Rhinichthys klamathensis goyatoka]
MATRKYVRRSIQEKNSLLEKYDQLPPMSQNAAARLLNISGPLLCVWLRKRKIKTAKSKLPRTVFSSRKTPRVEAALWRWIDTCLENGITVNDSIIRIKATEVATEMGLCDFRASSEWLTRFKTRESVVREMFDAKDGPEETKSGNKAAERFKEHNKNLTARKTHRMEAALWRWIDHSRENGINVNESTIRSKAARLARTVGYRNFRANTDWFTRFKTREGVIRGMFQISRKKEPTSDNKKTAIRRMDLTSNVTKIRQLEGALCRWIDHSRENGITVNESMIRSEATRLARMMGFRNFRSNGDWLSLFKIQPPSENTPSVSEVSLTNQSNDESESLTDLDIPKLDPTVITAELNGDLHSVTVPSLWQMKEAMKTLATGLLYRGFCDFKLLHQFEKEVDNVVRRSGILGS